MTNSAKKEHLSCSADKVGRMTVRPASRQADEALFVEFVCALDEFGEVLVGDMVVLHFTGEVLVICSHVYETMP